MKPLKKIVLAYSGGLDTSVVLRWLKDRYGCEIVTFTADLGQGEELKRVRQKAEQLGVREIFIEDLQEEFARDFVFPMFRANALYEGAYLLGSSIARPLIAKRQIEIARLVGADAVAHGATGKGNDQLRFELTYLALSPDIQIIAPWRDWSFRSRSDLLAFARENQISIENAGTAQRPYSIDVNLLHTSYEGEALEDPSIPPPEGLCTRTVRPEDAPNRPEELVVSFLQGDPVAVNGEPLSPANVLRRLNALGGVHGIGRVDMVENRILGMKTRSVYETPGGTLLHHAHRAIESLTMDGEAAHLKDELMPRYANLVYRGLWFSPERLMLQAAIDQSQKGVTGDVRMQMYKGSVRVIGRESPTSRYSRAHVTFEADNVYNQSDATGFIRLTGLRFQVGAAARTSPLSGEERAQDAT
ncbi:argininosuccinate synthase [Stigmatella sp. ncwal1]|uniref:Argininosuccinate synthase n=1 Tax=Stigmatella ashevillensis TaxID=2995309 RepID=A0ABT5D9J7_9BACT|nr:argininosuccinate synthase [Stigmatella ashevillena]MDC0710241.1 argininosuccinate synthase [Stigmatella ashevillena]